MRYVNENTSRPDRDRYLAIGMLTVTMQHPLTTSINSTTYTYLLCDVVQLVAQLVERLTVVCHINQSVLGSIPSREK